MTTLAASITASDRVIRVDAGTPTQRFRIDDELFEFAGYDRSVGGPRRRAEGTFGTFWVVNRGVGGSVAASHSGGATLKAAIEAAVSSTDLTPPDPFADGGGSGGVTVTDGTTTVDGATSIQSAFAVSDNGGNEAGIAGTITAPAGSEDSGDLVFEVQGETGFTLLSLDPYGQLNIVGARVDPTNGGASLRVKNSQTGASVLVAQAHDGSAGDGVMKLGFFETDAKFQPNLPPTPDAQDIADVLVALGLASQVAVALTGTALSGGVTESELVTGGQTIIITLTGATFIGTVENDPHPAEVIAGIVAAESEPNGWNIHRLTSGFVRTSDTVLTLTLAAMPAYAITADEHITITLPASVLVGTAAPQVATPVITVTANA